jgi:hypothetical protein
MKKWEIRILVSAGSTCWVRETIIASMDIGSAGYYVFRKEDGTKLYYPIDRVILEEKND